MFRYPFGEYILVDNGVVEFLIFCSSIPSRNEVKNVSLLNTSVVDALCANGGYIETRK